MDNKLKAMVELMMQDDRLLNIEKVNADGRVVVYNNGQHCLTDELFLVAYTGKPINKDTRQYFEDMCVEVSLNLECYMGLSRAVEFNAQTYEMEKTKNFIMYEMGDINCEGTYTLFELLYLRDMYKAKAEGYWGSPFAKVKVLWQETLSQLRTTLMAAIYKRKEEEAFSESTIRKRLTFLFPNKTMASGLAHVYWVVTGREFMDDLYGELRKSTDRNLDVSARIVSVPNSVYGSEDPSIEFSYGLRAVRQHTHTVKVRLSSLVFALLLGYPINISESFADEMQIFNKIGQEFLL